jgi:ActR/RegA family two-component response regulator/chemotaxis protein CheY-P-specific phosphatase CheC
MKTQERFDKILIAGATRIQEEVTALIGKSFRVGEPRTGPIDKETFFADLGGKHVLAHIQIDGDIQHAGCLLIGIKDAIRIGGTLIMLPDSELESVITEQQYSEELQDSYGEVANIICGAATVTFEEQYPKTVRLIRTEQEVVIPAKVDPQSDQPIADVPYYHLSAPISLEGQEMGNLYLLLPAEPFGLIEAKAKEKPAPKAADPAQTRQAPQVDGAEEAVGSIERGDTDDENDEKVGVLARPETDHPPEQDQAVVATPRKRDVGKQRKVIDGLLKHCWAKMEDEVSALLGGTLKVQEVENLAVTKEDFLDQAGGKQVMTRMELRGDQPGEAYLFVELKSAVYLGGSLIMLPESELEETVRSESFGDDARDAYGEVTNIIAGIFTSVFEEQYRQKIGFVKVAVEPVVPAKIDPDTDEVFGNQGYYLALGQLQYNDRDLGRLQLLVPATAFELEDLLLAGEVEAEDGQPSAAKTPDHEAHFEEKEPSRLRDATSERAEDILIVTDDEIEAQRLAQMLEALGYVSRILHFKESVNSLLTSRIQLVFLVMREVSEQGFGVAIKISSSGFSVPLVAAGPAWTRTMVLKAVKYGACDILVTPSTVEDVREKLATNLVKKAA